MSFQLLKKTLQIDSPRMLEKTQSQNHPKVNQKAKKNYLTIGRSSLSQSNWKI
jgi:hypothetical protein